MVANNNKTQTLYTYTNGEKKHATIFKLFMHACMILYSQY